MAQNHVQYHTDSCSIIWQENRAKGQGDQADAWGTNLQGIL